MTSFDILTNPRPVCAKSTLGVSVVKRVVNKLDVFAQAEKFARLVGLLQRPVVFVAVKDCDFGNDVFAQDRGREQFQFLAELADFAEDAAAAFKVMR